jgi:hypothetical protein
MTMLRLAVISGFVLASLTVAAHAECDLDKLGEDIDGILTSSNLPASQVAQVRQSMHHVGELIDAQKIDEACAAAQQIKDGIKK